MCNFIKTLVGKTLEEAELIIQNNNHILMTVQKEGEVCEEGESEEEDVQEWGEVTVKIDKNNVIIRADCSCGFDPFD